MSNDRVEKISRTVAVPIRCMSASYPEDNGFDLKDMVMEAIFEQRPLERKRKGRYKPSGLMKCKRKVFYDRLGVTQIKDKHDFDMTLWGEAGTAIHDRIQLLLRNKMGDEFTDEDMVEGIEFPARGYVDGEAYDWILEFKGIGTASFQNLTKPLLEHLWQVHMYMWLRDIPRAQILYINRDTWHMKNYKVAFDPDIWSRMMSIIGFIEESVELSDPPKKINKFWVCSKCEYAHECKPEIK